MNNLYPNTKQSFGIFGIYIALSLGIGLIMADLMHLAPTLFIATVAINGLTIIVALKLKNAPLDFLFSEEARFNWVYLPVILLADVAYIIVYDPLVNLIPMPDIFKEMMEQLLKKDIWAFLTVSIVAPVTEELLFRRVILTGLLHNYTPRKAIVMSAFLFALFHMNPWQGIGAFMLGIFMGWIFYKTKNIWLCIFMHWANNTIAFAGFYFSDQVDFSVVELTGTGVLLAIVILLSMACMYFCVKFLQHQFSKSPVIWNVDQEETEPQEPSEI